MRPPAEVASVWSALAALKDVVPGLLSARFGANHSPEGLSRGYTHAFVIEFRDATARDAYLDHPEHKAAGAQLVAICDGGVAGLCVLDI